ncbi:MAG: TonB-dependent receptor, partial [Micavibrio sp.]|nr:TonB-dependent receptor [Micavibrio sp.]
MMKRRSESGNIFFMLFGAVALVGVVAAATSTLMRGPLSTVVNVNARAKADTQMQIAAKLAMVRASQQNGPGAPPAWTSGDCDSDGNVEPIPAKDAGPKPQGGGQLPESIGASQQDPWGNAYGYCVWDIGTKNADGACNVGAGEVARLKGDYNNDYPVMLIVSSGPDRTFQTQCNDWVVTHSGPLVTDNWPNNFVGTNADQHTTATAGDVIYKPTGSDDIVISYSYDQASQVAGGLWSLMKSDPNKITTNKDIDVQTKANFASTATFQGAANFDPGSRIDLGFDRVGADTAGLFKLPNQTSLSTCNAANDGALRLNIVGTHNALQICDGKAGPAAWVDPSASGMTVTKIDDLTDAIASFSSQSKNIMLGDGTGINFTSASAGGNNVMLGIGSAANLASGGANSDNVILGSNTATSLTGGAHNIIIGSNINVPNAATSDFLTIGNLIYGTGMSATGSTVSTGNVGIGVAAPAVKLQVAGTVQGTQFQFNSSNALSFASSDITLSYGGVSQLFINGSGLGVGISPTHKLDVDGDAYAQRFVSTFSSASTLPGFAFGGDLSTGISHPGAGIIGLTVGGAEKARLNSTGLGIGTNAPTVALDVVGAGAFTTTVNAGTAFQFGSSNGMYNQGGGLSFNTGGAPRVYVTGTGLGVGLATPMVSIDAAGAIRAGMTTTCDPTVTGAIRFTSDTLEYCSIDGNWYSLFTAGGGGGGSNLWTNNTTYISRANAHFINASQSLPPALASAGTRFFWYPNKASFRAGGDGGSAWDDLNIGNYSTGLGYDTRASGDYSFSAGRTTDATGNYSFALGQGAVASGAHSFAFGLGSPSGTRPIVSGTNSFGIFMGDQNGRNITSSNTMELLGGKFLIDANPMFASSSTIGGLLTMDVNGDVGAEQYCDSDGAYCFTAESISTGAVGVFELSSNVIRMTSGPGNYATSSYVFGSPTLADDGDASHRKRLFFDKGSGSFRTGGTSGTQWDSVGAYSNGMGYDTVATGNYSVAIGQKVSATNTNSVAFGLGAAAGAAPTVSGAGSYGIFMGDQSAVNLSFSSTLGLFGGRMVIDPKNPATQLYARSVLDLGAATDAIVLPAGITAERPATAVNGMLRYNSANGKFEGYQGGAWQDILTSAVSGGAAAPDRGVQFNSGNNFAAVSTFIFTSAGRLGVGTATPTETLDIGTGRLTGGTYSALYRNTLELSGDSGQPAMDFALAGNGHFHVAMTSMVGTDDIFYQAIPPSTAGYGIFETWAGSGTIIGTGNATPIIFRPNRTERMRLTSAGNLGIGTVAPLASLEVAGTDAILFPRGTSSDRPSAPVNGMIRYNSGSGKFEGYQGGAWQDILTSAVSGGAAAPDRGIQFNSGNNFAASSNLVYSSSGAFMVSGTYTGGSALPASGAGTRMFFVPGIAAFRAGTVAGTEWDTSNLGTYSVAMGYGNLATSAYTVALGVGSRATSGYAVAIGQGVNASGNNGFGTGHNTVASGTVSTAMGEGSTASGAYAVAIGYANISKGSRSVTLGNVLFASGTASSAFGYGATTTGDYAMALGFGSASGVNPIVSGTSSYGLFMGNQGGVTLAASNTMGLFGGKFVIDPSTPATYLAAQTALDVNGSIKISDGGETCATLIKGAIRFTSLNTLQYCNGTAWTSTASSGSNVIAIDDLSDAITRYSSGNMYLGSGTGVLATTATTNNTALGAFAMQGVVSGSTNTAFGSYAMGANTSGYENVAVGSGTLAANTTGRGNVAIGVDALGQGSNATFNVAIGQSALQKAGSLSSVAVGAFALANLGAGQFNVAMGQGAGNNLTTSSNNTAVGTSALGANAGSYNSIFGSDAAPLMTGTNNTFLGYGTGATQTTGDYNIAIGSGISLPNSTGSNQLNIGNFIKGDMAAGLAFISSNGALMLPVGTTAQRPLAGATVNGMIRYNSGSGKFEGYQGGAWQDILTSAVSGGAAAPDRGVQFNSGGSFTASPTFLFSLANPAQLDIDGSSLNKSAYLKLTGAESPLSTGNDAGVILKSATSGNIWNMVMLSNTPGYNGDLQFQHYNGVWSNTMVFTSAGKVGVNTSDPATIFDVNGTIKISDGGETCTSLRKGAIRYNSANLLQYCNSTAWVSTAAGSGVIAIDDLSDAVTQYASGGSMYLGSGVGGSANGGGNTVLGYNAFSTSVGAQSNTAIGFEAMRYANNTGSGTATGNTAVGYQALTGAAGTGAGNTGIDNTAIGAGALASVTTATSNAAIGFHTLASTTTGNYNMGMGTFAGAYNTTGSRNTAVGVDSLTENRANSDIVAIGYKALEKANDTTSGTSVYNVAIGNYALQGSAIAANNTGTYNTAIGHSALNGNSSGSNNVAVGPLSLGANTVGASNVAIGYQALNTNVGAQQSTAVGYEAMRYANSTTGTTTTLNTALGYQALRGSTTAASNTGTWNTAVGSSALTANTSGLENTAIGAAALTANTTGGDNAAFGAGSLRYNTTGAANMGFGSWALYTNVSGTDNVGVGMQSLYSNVAGSMNVGVGRNTLYLASGSQNTAIGYNAGSQNTSGSGNILIGASTQTPLVTTSSWMNIGNLLTGDMSTGLAYVSSTSAIMLPVGTTAQRPLAASTVNGMIRYNSGSGKFEGYQAGAWQDILTGAATVAAAGSDKQVQFNNNGVFYASAGLTFSSASGALTVGNTAVGNGMTFTGGATSSNNPTVTLAGAATNIGLDFVTKGSGGFSFTGGTYIPASFLGNGESWVRSDSNGGGRAGYMMSAANGNSQWIMTAQSTNVFTIQAGNNVNSSPWVFSLDGSGNGQFGGLGALLVNAGSTADRPAAAINGMIRYNSTGKNFEGYQNGSWLPFSSASASPVLAIDDLTDAITVYSSGSMYVGAYSGATASGNNNTSLGYMAFGSAGNTAQNTAIGYEAMRYAESTSVNRNTKNTAVGFRALRGSSTASANTGTFNVAFGTNALQNNTSGDNNAAIGVDALGVNTTGANNSAFGAEALAANTTGSQNTAIGLNALYSNTAGSLNTAIGVAAMEANVARQENTAIGYNAMRYADSTVTTVSSYNTAIGNYALQGSTTAANNTGTNNTAIGYAALKLVTSGSSNMAIGVNALNTNATGSNNIAIGRSAGSTLTSGSNNLLFGSGVTTPAANTSDFMTIGNLIFASGGFGTVTTVGTGFVGIRTASPRVTFDITGTDAMMIPAGLTANRPGATVAVNGMMRYNTSTANFEGYQNGSWLPFSSAAAGVVTAAGANTQVQFNSGGIMGADSGFSYDLVNAKLFLRGDGISGLYTGGSTQLIIGTSNTPRITIGGTGGVSVADSLAVSGSTATNFGIYSGGGPAGWNFNLNYASSDNLTLSRVSGAGSLIFSSAYRVGFGTTAPTGPVDIRGGSASSGAGLPITVVGQDGATGGGNGGDVNL